MAEQGENMSPAEELAYIKYSAKEILFHLTQKIETMQAKINTIELNMVTRQEMTTTRRWAIATGVASASAIIGVLRLMGV